MTLMALQAMTFLILELKTFTLLIALVTKPQRFARLYHLFRSNIRYSW